MPLVKDFVGSGCSTNIVENMLRNADGNSDCERRMRSTATEATLNDVDEDEVVSSYAVISSTVLSTGRERDTLSFVFFDAIIEGVVAKDDLVLLVGGLANKDVVDDSSFVG